jgi:hypothetical protein
MSKELLIIIIILWTLPWKGLALWKSARQGDKAWFIFIFIVNTPAIFEILYIFIFSQKKSGRLSLK